MNPLDLFFPKLCLGCGKFGRYICPTCQQTIKFLRYLKCPVCEKPAIDGMTHPGCKTKYSMDGLTSFFQYDGIIRKAIKKIKYGHAFDITHELIDCIPPSSFSIITQLAASPCRQAGRNAFTRRSFNEGGLLATFCLVPIPLHSSRFRHRGFNQAEVIAQALGKRLNIPVRNDILKRIRKTTPQVEMKDRSKRLENMKNVFSLDNSPACSDAATSGRQLATRYSSILLVDDVFTTGATLNSAASVLKHAGFPFVWGITLAQ